jgi:hypothetical protein
MGIVYRVITQYRVYTLQYYPEICLEGLKRTTKCFGQNKWCPYRGLNKAYIGQQVWGLTSRRTSLNYYYYYYYYYYYHHHHHHHYQHSCYCWGRELEMRPPPARFCSPSHLCIPLGTAPTPSLCCGSGGKLCGFAISTCSNFQRGETRSLINRGSVPVSSKKINNCQ